MVREMEMDMEKRKIMGYEPLVNEKQINAPIGVATYQLRNTLPEEMKAMMPEPEEIVKRLRIFEE